MKNIFTYIIIFLLAVPTYGQLGIKKARRASFNLGVQLGFPEGEFKLAYGGNPFGVGGGFSIPTGKKSPLELGMALSWHSMGLTDDRISITSADLKGDIIEEFGEMSVANVSSTYHMKMRFRPFNTFVQIYFDGLLGFRAYTNKTELNTVGDFENLIQTENNFRDFAWSYGYGVGLRFKVAPVLFLDVRMEDLMGTEATYVDPASVEIIAENVLKFDEISSETDIQIYHIGLALSF